MLLTLLVFIIILSVLVLIHEAGHFFVAKWFNIKVEEFGFGFPPKAFSIKRGETVYSINWLPIGGFVKLYGEDDAGGGKIKIKNERLKIKEDIDRAFFARSVWQRAAVCIAGVVMNALLAIGIFYLFLFFSHFKTTLPLLTDYKFLVATQENKNLTEKDAVITLVMKGSPAEKAGMTAPSDVIAVNNKPVTDRMSLIKIINDNKGKIITLQWKNRFTGEVQTAVVTPRKNPPKNEGALGIGFLPTAILSYDTPQQRLLSGIVHPINLMGYNFAVLSKLISFSVENKTAAPLSQGVAGPVGIYSLVGSFMEISDAKERVLQLLNLAGLLSVSLALFNILPIPALDGGRLFFILIEGISGRKVNPRVETMIHTIGMAVLLTFLLLITFKDIFQFFL